MKRWRIYETSVDERVMEVVAEELRRGGTVVYPTETGYAVGCDARHNRATERVCQVKGINPGKQRLGIVCADISQASEYARIDNLAYGVMRRNLPGPWTFVLPATTALAKVFKGRKEVGVRVPENAIARALARALGNPLLSTSAYRGGEEDEGEEGRPGVATDPEVMAEEYVGKVDMLIDGGEVHAWGASGIVDLRDSGEVKILREGPRELV